MVGFYENGVKFKEISTDEKSSDFLVSLLEDVSKNFIIKRLIYANTPGSFMGLKVAYVVLKTFSIVKGCEFLAVSGFELNNGGAIRANKALCFVKKGDEILLETAMPREFKLPLNLEVLNLKNDTLPNYIIQAV